jgi:hypothetical protein
VPVRVRGERATGLVSTSFAVAVVVGLVALCANVAIGLWVRSTVDAVTEDAAARVAMAPVGGDLAAVAERSESEARALLGAEGDRVGLDWERLGPDRVVLRVRHPGVSLAPRMLGDRLAVGRVDRTIVIRREGVR